MEPDQFQDFEVMVGSRDGKTERPCWIQKQVRDPSNSEDSEIAQSEEILKGFGILSNFAKSEGARIEVIPRDFFILSDFTKSKVPRIEDVCEGIQDFLSIRIPKVARIEDVYEGFDDFWSILESLAVGEGPKPARNISLLILSVSLRS